MKESKEVLLKELTERWDSCKKRKRIGKGILIALYELLLKLDYIVYNMYSYNTPRKLGTFNIFTIYLSPSEDVQCTSNYMIYSATLPTSKEKIHEHIAFTIYSTPVENGSPQDQINELIRNLVLHMIKNYIFENGVFKIIEK